MMVRLANGWQTLLADLSLILFMVTAAGISKTGPAAKATIPRPVPPALGEPVAVWRLAPNAPSLRQWLQQETRDPRLQLTVIGSIASSQTTLNLAASADRPARVVLEPGPAADPIAALTYDRGLGLARKPDTEERPR